jgi:hypothetical protein
MNDSRRLELGLGPAINELLFVRERWANVTNQALLEAGAGVRVDHRSLAAQGIDREPFPHIPRAAYEMERHGYRSGQAEWIRAEYQARVQARVEARSAALVEQAAPPQAARSADRPAQGLRSLEDIRREARENWRRMRDSSSADPGERAPPSVSRAADDDFTR